MKTEYVEITIAVPDSKQGVALEDLRKYFIAGGPLCVYKWECKDDMTYEQLVKKLPSFCVYEPQQTFEFKEATDNG